MKIFYLVYRMQYRVYNIDQFKSKTTHPVYYILYTPQSDWTQPLISLRWCDFSKEFNMGSMHIFTLQPCWHFCLIDLNLITLYIMTSWPLFLHAVTSPWPLSTDDVTILISEYKESSMRQNCQHGCCMNRVYNKLIFSVYKLMLPLWNHLVCSTITSNLP